MLTCKQGYQDILRIAPSILRIPKYCRRILNPGLQRNLRKLSQKILRILSVYEILEYNIQPGHIHLVMIKPPGYSLSDLIGQIKIQSSTRPRKKFFWLSKFCLKVNIVCSNGSFISTVGIDEKSIIEYVKF